MALLFDQFLKLRTQCVFKNIKMKAMIAHKLKALYLEPAPKVFQEPGKIRKIARRTSVMKCIFDNIAGM